MIHICKDKLDKINTKLITNEFIITNKSLGNH